MKEVPVSRFRREIRKHIRKQECITVTRNGKAVFVFLTVDAYDLLLKNLS